MEHRFLLVGCAALAVLAACGAEDLESAGTDTASSTSSTAASTGATGGGGSGGDGAGGTAVGRLGRVFEKTPADGPPVDRPLTRLPDGAPTLTGAVFELHSCTGDDCLRDVSQLAVADAEGHFLFDFDPSLDPPSGQDPAAEVNAYYHLERFASRLETLGFPSIDPGTHVIVGFRYDFDGDGRIDEFFGGATDVLGAPGLLMGIVGSRNMAYDPDVYGHELMHLYQGKSMPALQPFLVATGLAPVGRALGEGTADYYSCTVMGDPDVGEYGAGAYGGPYLSTLENDAVCPADLVGQPHHDGQIFSGALWEARSALGADVVDAALRDTLLELTPGASWPIVLERLRAAVASRTTPEMLEAYDEIVAARGLATCETVVPLTEGVDRRVYVSSILDELLDPANGDVLSPSAYPSGIQLALSAPEGATVTLSFAPEEDAPELADVTVYLRQGAPVEFAVIDGHVVVTADTIVDDPTSPIVLSPTGTLHLALGGRGYAGGFVLVHAIVDG